MKAILYSDMDGTLLDHDTYSFKPAMQVLQEIKERAIPLILTTSKTRAEVLLWQEKLGIQEPFITENGAGVFFPKGYKNFDLKAYPLLDGFHLALLGKEYAFITKYLETVQNKYEILGFSQMSLAQVCKYTGLDEQSALFAKKRDFSEPFVIKDATLVPLLEKEAQMYGLKIVEGGRFFHCIGAHQDKGKALQIAQAIFRRNGYEAKSIALGDGKNDESMLGAADFSIQIPKPNGDFVSMNVNTQKADFPGPRGWAQMLKKFLSAQ